MKGSYLIIGVIAIIVIFAGIYLLGSESEVDETENTTENSYMDLSAAEARQFIEDNPEVIIIDVSPHYDEGHLPGAVGYYPASELQAAISSLDMEATYLVYCHADGPSRAGAQALIDAGFMNVYRLEDHFGGWEAAGYEIEQ